MNLARYAGLALIAVTMGLGVNTASANCVLDPGHPESTPDSDFSDVGNGMVRHIPSGLIWKRCAEGQSWDGSTCVGMAADYTWAEAFARTDVVNAGAAGTENGGETDWRIPNIKELFSLVERGCVSININETQFPNSPQFFWSSSPLTGWADGVWGVYLGDGTASAGSRSVTEQLRLVRGGDAFDALAATSTAEAIPALGPLGLVLLSGVLGVLGLVVRKRGS